MSIVVAVKKRNRVVMAADSLICFGEDERISAANAVAPKTMKIGSAILGGTGWAVYDDILRDHLKDRPAPRLDDQQAIFVFFLELWKALRENYILVNEQASNKDTPFADLDSTFMIANPNGIYKISSDMGITRFNQYYAIGCASAYALGALHQLYDTELDAEAVARRAVETGIEFDVHCGGEITIMSTA